MGVWPSRVPTGGQQTTVCTWLHKLIKISSTSFLITYNLFWIRLAPIAWIHSLQFIPPILVMLISRLIWLSFEIGYPKIPWLLQPFSLLSIYFMELYLSFTAKLRNRTPTWQHLGGKSRNIWQQKWCTNYDLTVKPGFSSNQLGSTLGCLFRLTVNEDAGLGFLICC